MQRGMDFELSHRIVVFRGEKDVDIVTMFSPLVVGWIPPLLLP